ncbi:MAG: PAS domain-containing protein [Alphaproteobacteria bacterium]|nr:PAS domain-containing protein [Alphaproteobacteria bacterium]
MGSRRPPSWSECDESTDLNLWTEPVRQFFQYWLAIRPQGALPGRQHFDPLHIYKIMSRVWILDVVRADGDIRLKYRLVGTKEVDTLRQDVTGRWLDEVHPHLRESPGALDRYRHMVETGRATYRKGPVIFTHDPDHRMVENCMAPMARDGQRVDMIAICSAQFLQNGKLAN